MSSWIILLIDLKKKDMIVNIASFGYFLIKFILRMNKQMSTCYRILSTIHKNLLIDKKRPDSFCKHVFCYKQLFPQRLVYKTIKYDEEESKCFFSWFLYSLLLNVRWVFCCLHQVLFRFWSAIWYSRDVRWGIAGGCGLPYPHLISLNSTFSVLAHQEGAVYRIN